MVHAHANLIKPLGQLGGSSTPSRPIDLGHLLGWAQTLIWVGFKTDSRPGRPFMLDHIHVGLANLARHVGPAQGLLGSSTCNMYFYFFSSYFFS